MTITFKDCIYINDGTVTMSEATWNKHEAEIATLRGALVEKDKDIQSLGLELHAAVDTFDRLYKLKLVQELIGSFPDKHSMESMATALCKSSYKGQGDAGC